MTAAIAQWRDVPEIEIDDSEAKELMGATQNVLRHYSVETTQKGADFIALFGVVAMIGGTRVSAYNLRKRMEREERQPSGNVYQMPGKFPGNVRQQPAPQAPPAPPPQAPQTHSQVPTGPVDDSGGF